MSTNGVPTEAIVIQWVAAAAWLRLGGCPLFQHQPLTTPPREITMYDVISERLTFWQVSSFVLIDALHEGDCMGAQLVGLVGLADNGKWDSES